MATFEVEKSKRNLNYKRQRSRHRQQRARKGLTRANEPVQAKEREPDLEPQQEANQPPPEEMSTRERDTHRKRAFAASRAIRQVQNIQAASIQQSQQAQEEEQAQIASPRFLAKFFAKRMLNVFSISGITAVIYGLWQSAESAATFIKRPVLKVFKPAKTMLGKMEVAFNPIAALVTFVLLVFVSIFIMGATQPCESGFYGVVTDGILLQLTQASCLI